ncbi:MAG: hypothetical protein AAF690_21305 [Acidobacteriota bacterium]
MVPLSLRPNVKHDSSRSSPRRRFKPTRFVPLFVELVSLGVDERIPEISRYGKEALDWLQRRSDDRAELHVRLALAWTLTQTGDSVAALEHAARGRELAKSVGEADQIADAEYYTAVAHYVASEPT